MQTNYKSSLIQTLGFVLVAGTIIMPMLKQPEAKPDWRVYLNEGQTIAERKSPGWTRLIDVNSDGILDSVKYSGRFSREGVPTETEQRIYSQLTRR